MITNERQYRITRTHLSKLAEAVQTFDIKAAARRIGSAVLAKAELEALKSEVEVLSDQLHEYENLKAGIISTLKAKSLNELPRILVQARIARGYTQSQLADLLKLKEQAIQRYESEEYASASLRRLAEVAEVLQLNISEVAEFKQSLSEGPPAKSKDIDWSRFPVDEMYRRNWFEGFNGSLEDARVDANLLIESFVKSVIQQPSVSLYRKKIRSGSVMNMYALLAWECRILQLAKQSTTEGAYNSNSLDERWLKSLVHESQYLDGPVRAKKRLTKVGITLVVEPHLPHTYLDGAALLHGGKPVIGLTLRYDRLDNFWFVLLHELIHIIKHLREDRLLSIFDDIDAETNEADELEREADDQAQKILIPDNIWETAMARYVRSEGAIDSLAKDLRINHAIIAGRIRKEANNYLILNQMIGQGEVRKYFPEVRFG